MTTPNRRHFLIASATAVAASRKAIGANDTISVGIIGSGGRARHLMKSLVKVPGVRIDAVCDIWDQALLEGKKLADANATTTKRYQELLDRKGIDAVLIGSPDHWHALQMIDAVKAGAHVYVQKPISVDVM